MDSPGAPGVATMSTRSRRPRLASRKSLGERLRSMEKEIAQLSFLVEASKLLNSSLELDRLLEVIVDLAVRGSGCQRGTLYLVDPVRKELWSKVAQGLEKVEIRLPMGHGIAGHVAETGDVVCIADAYGDPRFNRDVDRAYGFRTENLLTVPMKNKLGAIIGVLQVLNKERGPFGDDDVVFLEVLQTHAAIAIENALLYKEALEKKRIERELDLAAEIQRKLLPASAPVIAGLEIAAHSEPCRQVGGDYFDFLAREGGLLGICIADVSGKGIPASLLMATLRASLRAQAENEGSAAEVMRKVNVALFKSSKPSQFASCFYCEVDPDLAALTYVNAGHLPPFHLKPNGDVRLLTGGGLLLGLRETSCYEEVRVELDPGDAIAFYTDGVTDARSPQGLDYGEERLRDLVAAAAAGGSEEALARIMSSVADFEQDAPRTDDLTVVMLRRLTSSQRRMDHLTVAGR